MKKYILFLLLLPFGVFAQKQGSLDGTANARDRIPAQSIYPFDQLASNNAKEVLSYLSRKLGDQLDLNRFNLVLENCIHSPGGIHYTFQQQFEGVSVYNGQVKINIDISGRVRSIFNNTKLIGLKKPLVFPSEELATHYVSGLQEVMNVEVERVLFPLHSELEPALLLIIRHEDHRYYEVVINNQGVVLYQEDQNRYFSSMQDSVVSAAVFLPDPLTTAGVSYGAPYADNSDTDVPELLQEIDTVSITVDFTNDTFRLVGPYVEILDFSNPSIDPVTSDSNFFYFTRSDDGFEDVNCYYHLHAFQEYMQSLGFMNLVNYPIEVDPHALNGADNSMFSGNQLYFGDGGVDDAEDADVVIHEYGHAITASAAPNTWDGFERKAMDEGIGDYLATSYGRAINPHNWADMFSWDGHNEFWPGRTVVTSKTYPNDLGFSTHSAGEIWSSTLMQIWDAIGKEATDKNLLQSLYSFASNMSMTDAAYLFLDADSLLHGGAHYFASYYWFEQRGILPPYPNLAGYLLNTPITTCIGACDATAIFTAYNGTPPYFYEWRDSLGNPIGQAGDTATGLCGGTYQVMVSDASGDSVVIAITINEPSPVEVSFTTVPAQCATCNDGIISAQVTGGSAPYTYLWNDPSAQTNAEATGLTPGNYTLQVIDANGCSLSSGGTIELLVGAGEPDIYEFPWIVAPNPNTGQFVLINNGTDLEIQSICVYNNMGQLILQKEDAEINGYSNPLDLGGCPAGLYNILIVGPSQKMVLRITKI